MWDLEEQIEEINSFGNQDPQSAFFASDFIFLY